MFKVDNLLDRLCDILDAELVRQETILAICRKKRDALRVADIQALEARTAALEAVLRESFEAEAERHHLLHALTLQMGLPQDAVTLTRLVEAVPEPWKSRLKHFQRQLKKTLETTQSVTRGYVRELRHRLQVCGQNFARLGFDSKEGKSGLYDSQGWRPETPGISPALVNQRG
ncbi:MAG TPA: flagellar export chaperone FlgN [Candidatus Hydrogenedentes bacterium]|nr:flagellar export chaperone FlgN [Candidatus Hydrogenedentota bacterium]HQH53726.1 flagellar export chaperone FlgN [Candidatus Hydrogenedentota bacterium]